MKEGKPIWVESLLPDGNRYFPMFECEFKWRYGMGSYLSFDEIRNINSNLDILLRKYNLYNK